MSTEATVKENVSTHWKKPLPNNKLFQTIDPDFSRDFDRLMHEVLDNYEKRNLSLLDFLDFYESYKDNVLHLTQYNLTDFSAFEDINYYTGTEFFNLNMLLISQFHFKFYSFSAYPSFSRCSSCKVPVEEIKKRIHFLIPF